MTHDEQPSPPTRPTSPLATTRPTLWHTPPPDEPGCLTVELAVRLMEDHTHPGQVVIDLDDDPCLDDVAAATGRDHHVLHDHTDTEAVAHYAARADLLVLHWPRPATNPRHLLLAARTLLKDTGLLAIVVHVPTPKRTAHLVALTGAAHTAGFHLLRHIVAITSADDTPGQPARGRTVHPHTDLLILQLQAGRHD